MDTEFKDRLAAAFKLWEETPFRPLHCQKQVGVCCANLCIAILRDAGVEVPAMGEPTFGFTPQEARRKMHEFISQYTDIGFMTEVCGDIQPGDLLLFSHDKRTQHLSIAIDVQTMASVTKNSVVRDIFIDDRWMDILVGHYRLNSRM